MADALKPCECGWQRTPVSAPWIDRQGGKSRVRCACCPASTTWYDGDNAAIAAWNRRAPLPSVEAVAKAICREGCAYRGEPPCWEVGAWPNEQCDEPGCMAKATAVLALIGGEK